MRYQKKKNVICRACSLQPKKKGGNQQITEVSFYLALLFTDQNLKLCRKYKKKKIYIYEKCSK